MTRVDVLIDELVLVGFDPRDRLSVADALERELERAMTRADIDALLAAERSRPSLTPIDVLTTTGADAAGASVRRPEAIGAQVGTAVAGALGRGTAPIRGGRGS